MAFVIQKRYVSRETLAFKYIMTEFNLTMGVSQRHIAKGRLFVNGEPMTKANAILLGEIEFVTFEPTTKGLEPICYDNDLAAYDKPSGMLIHPQNRYSNYTLVDEIKHKFGMDANITHRIDQETSGLVLAALHKESERTLKMMFESRDIKKRYLAFVHGEVSRETLDDYMKIDYVDVNDGFLDIKAPLLRAKDEDALVRMVVKVDESGKQSHTLIRPISYFKELDLSLDD